MTTMIAAAVESSSDGSDAGPGLLGFLVVAFLLLALFLLYRSMRKQLRRVDFDADGVTDEERMRRHGPHQSGPIDHSSDQ